MSEVLYERDEVKRARYALAAVFAVHGAVTGSFATRVPWIQDHASVSAGQLGLALAFPALGASLAMPLAGRISHRFGARTALRGLITLWTLALVLPALAPNLPTLCLALFVYGATAGMADVGMNALGVEIENRLGRSIMSGLHGMWSAGALIGAAGGTLAAHLGSTRACTTYSRRRPSPFSAWPPAAGCSICVRPRTRSRPRGSRFRPGPRC